MKNPKPKPPTPTTVNPHLPHLINIEASLATKTQQKKLQKLDKKTSSTTSKSMATQLARIRKLKKQIQLVDKANLKLINTKKQELAIKRDNLRRLEKCIEANQSTLADLEHEDGVLSRRSRRLEEEYVDYEKEIERERKEFLQKFEDLHMEYSKSLSVSNLENFGRYKMQIKK